MATPNSFSNLLGVENRHFEKLISRGACISWTPKNLASALVMFSIRWMVKHTEFRFFTAYSDVEARELGTIYQACNFIYLGQNSGAREEFFDPKNPKKGWFSDRQFRKTSQIRRYARELGIGWQSHWSSPDKIHWDEIPVEIAGLLKERAAQHRRLCQRRALHAKHKYVYVLGRSKGETTRLRRLFEDTNPDLCRLPYPKIRGPSDDEAAKAADTAASDLTENSRNCRPHGRTSETEKVYLTVKEVAEMLRVSDWTVYSLIKTDRTFPCLNIGLKKKLVIERAKLAEWTTKRTRRQLLREKNLPTGDDLLQKKGLFSA